LDRIQETQMTIRIGILSIKGPDYHPSRRLAEAAEARGAEVVVLDPYSLSLAHKDGKPVFLPVEITDGLHAVLPRQGAGIKTAALAVIGHFEKRGMCVINKLSGILTARNKYLTCQVLAAAGLAVPETVYATSLTGCHLARKSFAPRPTVIKPISGRQGTGIHCLDPDAALPGDIMAELESKRGVLVQAFIPPGHREDVRALVVGSKVIGAVSLTPPEGDFRSNFHVGSKVVPFDMPADLARLACRAVQAVGLDVAGVDLILPRHGLPMIVEVNYAPGFRGLESATGIDVAGEMVSHALSEIKQVGSVQ
jgi:ribosomal protein S6--L-glutamate ligase